MSTPDSDPHDDRDVISSIASRLNTPGKQLAYQLLWVFALPFMLLYIAFVGLRRLVRQLFSL